MVCASKRIKILLGVLVALPGCRWQLLTQQFPLPSAGPAFLESQSRHILGCILTHLLLRKSSF